jgi:hypothetical protein
LRVPAAPRTPVDVMAIPSTPAPTYGIPTRELAFTNSSAATNPSEFPPVHDAAALPEVRHATRAQAPASRPITGAAPIVRPADGKEGRTLPRAYVARRRLTPRNTPVIPDTAREAVAESPSSSEFDARRPDETPGTAQPVDFVDVAVDNAMESHLQAAGTLLDEGSIATTESVETTESVGAIEHFDSPSMHALRSSELEESVASQESIGSVAPPDSFGTQTANANGLTPLEIADVAPRASATPPADVAPPVDPEEPSIIAAGIGSGSFEAASPPVEPVSRPPEAVAQHVDLHPIVAETPRRLVDEAARPPVQMAAAPQSFNSRHIVLFLLAVVAVAIVVSAAVAIYVERRFAPPATAPVSTDR